MFLSIIIPTLNEAKHIGRLIDLIQANAQQGEYEVLVVDGGSQDETVAIASSMGVIVHENCGRGRAIQMNYGAQKAKGEILYFVHGDTLPVASFVADIKQALAEGFPVGCYRYRFDSPRLLLKINAYFTRFNRLWCRGGDQTLFIKRDLFEELKGFRSDFPIMEEYEFLERVMKRYPFKIIPKSMIVSARKYDNNHYLKVQVANFVAFNMYRLRFPPAKIAKVYKKMLH